MKSSNGWLYLIPVFSLLACGCSSSSSSTNDQTCTSSIYDPIDSGQVPNTSLSNVMSLKVNMNNTGSACEDSCFTSSNAAACASSSPDAGYPCLYQNEPTATVTVCQHGSTTECQTFNNLLVDTGSSGLRIFSNSLDANGIPLTGNASSVFPAAPSPSSSLWDCVEFGDGSAEWGQAVAVDVWLGSGGPTSSTPGEVASNINMQVIQYDPTGNGSSYCAPAAGGNPADTSPQEAGFTGILGVGLEPADCNLTLGCAGTVGCTGADEAAGICGASGYYSCTGAGGTSCVAANPTSNAQLVQNPVTGLSTDNNGVILAFPGNIPQAGAAAVSGYLTLGIGTQSNNQISSQVTRYSVFPMTINNLNNGTADNFTTNFSSTDLNGFIDSGSNFFYFPEPSDGVLPICSDDPSQTFDRPNSVVDFSAVNTGSNGATSGCVDFQIANADNAGLIDGDTSSSVFQSIGGTSGTLQEGASFDWGFPFFLGKSVYVGFDGASANPYWAY